MVPVYSFLHTIYEHIKRNMFLSSVTSYKQQLWQGRALLIMSDTKLRTRWRNQKVQLEELQRNYVAFYKKLKLDEPIMISLSFHLSTTNL